MDEEKVSSEGSEGKEDLLDHKNIPSKLHQNLLFFEGVSPWFLQKKLRFLNHLFLCKIDQVKVLCKGSNRKEDFLDNKNITLKNNQNLHLFQEVSPWFL